MKKPLIGISASILLTEEGLSAGTERSNISNDYIKGVLGAGGVPVILPAVNDDDAIRAQILAVDGVLMSGGVDLDPQLYHEEPIPKLGAITPERDEYELKVIKIAQEFKKPILGICRGIQLINVAFGGTLYQDLESQFGDNVLKHSQTSRKYFPGHTVQIVRGSVLHEIMSVDEIKTNSFHHQAVKDIAPSFIISAQAKDGVIEAIEKPGEHFILGVQWHPEMMFEKYPEMLKLFKRFVDSAR